MPRPKAGRAAERLAFTLIELLVVIAITVILFALLLRPLVESLRLTQSAQVQAAAQDSARTTLERITRELSSAVFVYDNASHPFSFSSGAVSDTTKRYDKYTDFLNLEVTKSDGTFAVEQAYNAKLDIVPARHQETGKTDPTAGNEPIQIKGGTTGSATLSANGLLFPLAPGSTIVRLFVGLKRPVEYTNGQATQGHYSNSNEGLLAAASSTEDNTYVLYRAQFAPYKKTISGTGAAATTKYDVNTDLMDTRKDSTGNDVVSANGTRIPELDDPDFFRYVTTGDINWLSAGHGNYTSGEAAAHNARVENWVKIAKPVITAPDIDLLALPHNPDNSIRYDGASDPIPDVAHSGVVTDPVTGKVYPVVTTTVSFRPAVIQGDAAPGTTTDYSSQGIPANAADNGGLPYIPALYTASSKSWGFPPHITLFPNTPSTTSAVSYFDTDVSQAAQTSAMGVTLDPGDLIENYHPNGSATGYPVFDITKGAVLSSNYTHNYVPMAVNTETGAINFDMPALPAPPNQNSAVAYNPYQRFWSLEPGTNGAASCPGNQALNNGTLLACPVDPSNAAARVRGVIDLTSLFADPNGVLTTTGGANASPLPSLGQNGTVSTPTGLQCANAFLVPGSLRVYGPDATPGPNQGNRVLYSPVSPGTLLNFNEYRVDYLNSTLTFYVDTNDPTASAKLPESKTDPATGNTVAADPVQFAFNYQANLAPIDPTKGITPDNPASPLLVKVDYQTRDLIDINIGVRIYDSSQGRATTVPVSSRVQIGNSNR